MTRPLRVALISGGAFVLLLLIVAIGGVAVLRSQWFRDQVRRRIIAEAEQTTGGRVEIGSFTFDWHTLTATLRDVTLHGTEKAPDPALLHADDLIVGLKILSLWKEQFDLTLVRVDRPVAFLRVAPDGTTNLPEPKVKSTSKKSPTETILDLAIQRFELNNGVAQVVATATQRRVTKQFAAHGDNLHALFTFDPAVPRYHGDISVSPLSIAASGYKPMPAAISATLAIGKNQIVVEKAHLQSGDSEVTLNGQLNDFMTPVITAEYQGRIALAQVGSVLELRSRESGWMDVSGSASYRDLKEYSASGTLQAYEVSYRDRSVRIQNVSARAVYHVTPALIAVEDVRGRVLGGDVSGKAQIRDLEHFQINANLRGFDIQRLAAIETKQKLPYDGVVSGVVIVEGRLSTLARSRFNASGRLKISPVRGTLPVNGSIEAKFNGAAQTLDLGRSYIALPNTRLDFSGVLGRQLDVRFASSDLNDLMPVLAMNGTPGQRAQPIPVKIGAQGALVFTGSVTGALASPSLTGQLNGADFLVRDQRIDAIKASIAADRSNLTLRDGSVRQGALSATFAGSVGLKDWSPTEDRPVSAQAALSRASIQQLAALAGQTNVPAAGTLSATAKITGTVGAPQAIADATVTNGNIDGEPFDRVTAHLDAPARGVQTLQSKLTAGAQNVTLNATYTHPPAEFLPGDLAFKLQTNTIALEKLVLLHQREPDLSGAAQVAADGSVHLARDAKGNLSYTIARVNGQASALNVDVAGRQIGDIQLTAQTTTVDGTVPQLEVKLRSNLATATVTGDGRWNLGGNYEGSGKVQLSNVNLDTLRRLILTPQQAETAQFGGHMRATIEISGPALKPEEMKGSLEIPTLEVFPLRPAGSAAPAIDLTVKNSGPIRASYENGVIQIDSARLVAEDSDFSVTGRARVVNGQFMNLHANGQLNLAILHLVDNDVVSSGHVAIDAGLTGHFENPQLNGRLSVVKANLSYGDLPNGLSNLNGTISFNGNQATIQSLAGESGGGKVSFSGFATLVNGALSFRTGVTAEGVRVRYPRGVSTVADADLRLVGNSERSILSGNVTVDRLSFNPKTDLGSLLSSATGPQETPSASTGFTSRMQFDIGIATSPAITFESSYTQSLEADANLRLRGTLTNPVLLGRINVTQGDIVFFGNKYTINQGTISFFNPVKLVPVLNVDLETVARGVDVTITISGPITKLNVSYRSDPPIQFSDLVALLATGRTPNDATLVARQPTAPQQSWQQMGASALVGQAIANPVAGRLQRFFGVSSLKIDPSISGATNTPQAKVTLEQQVTPDITFTYITDVANAQEQVIRVEWAFSPHWSAVALRDENGEFGVDFLYKKSFR